MDAGGDAEEVDFRYREALLLLAETDPSARKEIEANGADLKKLQGTWEVVREERDGKALEKSKKASLQFTGGLARGDLLSGFVLLDSTATPKQMDIFGLQSDFFVHNKALYDLEGDLLRICWQQGDRPTDFSTEDRPDVRLLHLRRVNRKGRKGS